MEISLGNLTTNMVVYRATIYTVGDGGSVEQLLVRKFPISVKVGNSVHDTWILTQPQRTWIADLENAKWVKADVADRTDQQQSMRDMGIIPNNYNQHKTFSTLTEALNYFESTLNVTLQRDTSDYDRAMKVLDLD